MIISGDIPRLWDHGWRKCCLGIVDSGCGTWIGGFVGLLMGGMDKKGSCFQAAPAVLKPWIKQDRD